ncbi:putative Glycosyltransferase [marine gamma proteobacterium HTCC2080]|nr:putative Glycosyltransferase [marine gamma proteobacterium HTCC2080]
MRIVLDCQSLQSASRKRGIGRYTRCVLAALRPYTANHEFILLFNARLSSTLDQARFEAAELLPQAQLVVFDVPAPTAGRSSSNSLRRDLAELIREQFIAELRPDVVHVFSLFEGFLDNVVTSIGRLPSSYPVSSTFFDLIPLLNPEEYLDDNSIFRDFYLRQVEQMKQSQRLLAISAFSAREASDNLDYPERHIVEAPLGPMQQHGSGSLSDQEADLQLKGLGLSPNFILYVGGSDRRKNLPRLAEAWCQLPSDLQVAHPLVMAGSMPESDIAHLKGIAQEAVNPDRLILLGQVSDAQLRGLYRGCSVFVFPSWHEGFGLPALEAMVEGVAVIAANTSSLPEVVGLNEALFNPFDVADIATHLQRALTDPEFRQRLIDHGKVHSQLFSWPRTAETTVACWEEMQQAFSESVPKVSQPQSWEYWMEEYEGRLDDFLDVLSEALRAPLSGGLRGGTQTPDSSLLQDIARVLEVNEREIFKARACEFADISPWRVEGPFDSSYSLALVNREFASALDACGVEVALHSTEGPGDFEPDARFLNAHPALAAMHKKAVGITPTHAAVLSRNLYPPRVADMPRVADGHGTVNTLHCWGWEEGAVPVQWVADFNTHLTGITTMSRFVRKVLIDAGVKVPVEVAGIGVDHWLRVTPDPSYSVPEQLRAFVFLHVSSCFPRKGVDVLLEAYGQAFTGDDDVSLLIKTFPNPHNRVHELLASAQGQHSNYPHVVIVEKDLSPEQLKALMTVGDALVAPSRGEGYGLPLAEAMLMDIPVITTAYGGQMDFCSDETAWCVDFDFATADTHFALPGSVWAEPRMESLRAQLLAVRSSSRDVVLTKVKTAKAMLFEKHTWRHVAQRASRAALSWQEAGQKKGDQPFGRLAWISTWGTRCGIATYSENLVTHASWPIKIFASELTESDKTLDVDTDEQSGTCTRCWHSGGTDDLQRLACELDAFEPAAVVVQFNYGFFDLSALAGLIENQKAQGRVVMVVLHSTQDPPDLPERSLSLIVPALAQCDRLLVHGVPDLNRLKAIGLTDNTALVPHGILEWPAAKARRTSALLPEQGALAPPAQSAKFAQSHSGEATWHRDEDVDGGDALRRAHDPQSPALELESTSLPGARPALQLASFGFFLPHKGLSELVEAMSILKRQGFACHLLMLNAQYPAEASVHAIYSAHEQVKTLGLEADVTIDTAFYSNEQCLQRLAAVDVAVFPYQETGESASGAVRHAIASGTPVVVTPLAIFQDVHAATYTLPGCTPEKIAAGLIPWIQAKQKLQEPMVPSELVTENNQSKPVQPAQGELSGKHRPTEDWLESHFYRGITRRLESLLAQLSYEPR